MTGLTRQIGFNAGTALTPSRAEPAFAASGVGVLLRLEGFAAFAGALGI